MGAAAVTCPWCGVRYHLPHSLQPDPHSPARPRIGADGAVSVQVNQTVVHQCQPGIDPVTGKKAWRPARTVVRGESRGVHFRADFPVEDAALAAHTVLRPGRPPAFEPWP